MGLSKALAVVAAAAFLGGTPALAKVAAAHPDGFRIQVEVEIAAKPAAVWERLVRPNQWWNSQHSWSGNAKNLSLDPVAGGCWCETWRDSTAEHMRVIYVEKAKDLRLTGALGPLQFEGVAGQMEWKLAPQGDAATKLTLTYIVGGYSEPGLDVLAPDVDEVLSEQVTRLKASLEKPGAN